VTRLSKAEHDTRLAEALAAIRGGSATIRDIALRLDIPRATAASYLRSLEERGLVTHVTVPAANVGCVSVYSVVDRPEPDEPSGPVDIGLIDLCMRRMCATGRELRA
jgi:predicted transcriptional regulator